MRQTEHARGQAGTELLILLALGLIVLGIVYGVAGEQLLGTQQAVSLQHARQATQELAASADRVAAQGVGARESVTVTLPDNLVLFNASCNEIALARVSVSGGESDVAARARRNFCCANVLPEAGGRFEFIVENTASCVSVRQATDLAGSFTLSPGPVFALLSHPSPTVSLQTVTVSSHVDYAVNVTLYIDWAHASSVSVTFQDALLNSTATYVFVPAGSTNSATVRFEALAGSLGNYVGTLLGVGSDGNATGVELSATVLSSQSTGGGEGNVSSVQVRTFVNASYSREDEAFPRPETIVISGADWTPDSTVTLNVSTAGVSISGYPKLVATDGAGAFSDAFLALVLAAGAYNVTANDSTRARSTAFEALACEE